MQSARLVGQGRKEITPTYSHVSVGSGDNVEHVQYQVGVQGAIGLSQKLGLRMRYERIQLANGEPDESSGTDVLAIGPKFSLVRDRVALGIPVDAAPGVRCLAEAG